MHANEWLQQWSEKNETLKQNCSMPVPQDDILAPFRELYLHKEEYKQRVKETSLRYEGLDIEFLDVQINNTVETVIYAEDPPSFYMGKSRLYKLIYGKDVSTGEYVLRSLDNQLVYYHGIGKLSKGDIAKLIAVDICS